jgi:hypothetical protein
MVANTGSVQHVSLKTQVSSSILQSLEGLSLSALCKGTQSFPCSYPGCQFKFADSDSALKHRIFQHDGTQVAAIHPGEPIEALLTRVRAITGISGYGPLYGPQRRYFGPQFAAAGSSQNESLEPAEAAFTDHDRGEVVVVEEEEEEEEEEGYEQERDEEDDEHEGEREVDVGGDSPSDHRETFFPNTGDRSPGDGPPITEAEDSGHDIPALPHAWSTTSGEQIPTVTEQLQELHGGGCLEMNQRRIGNDHQTYHCFVCVCKC